MSMNPEVEKIRKRQTAKLLNHMRQTGQLTDRLERDICRSFHWFGIDVQAIIDGQTKEDHHGHATTEIQDILPDAKNN